MTRRSERGAGAVLVLAIAGLISILAIGVGDVARYLTVRGSVVAAADAAALASAPVTFRSFGARAGPAAEAARFAALNGARLVACRCPVDRSWAEREVEVVVEAPVDLWLLGRRTLRATGRARFTPTRLHDG